jgi:hypothetical protein
MSSKLSPSPAGDLSGSYSDISASQHNLSPGGLPKHKRLADNDDDDEDDASSLASLLHDGEFGGDDDDIPLSRLEMQDPLDAKLDPQNWTRSKKIWVAVGVAFYT